MSEQEILDAVNERLKAWHLEVAASLDQRNDAVLRNVAAIINIPPEQRFSELRNAFAVAIVQSRHCPASVGMYVANGAHELATACVERWAELDAAKDEVRP